MVDFSKLVPQAYVYSVLGVVFSGLFIVTRFIVKKTVAAIKAEWQVVSNRLERIEDVQGVQAENHLTTIQANTSKTNEILQALQVDLAEQTGYLKAIAEKK